jgi:polyisoprenoid-binding protein YceI
MWTRSPITLTLVAVLAATARAQSIAELAVGEESRVWIEGSSNIHGWSCSATAIDATIAVDVSFKEDPDFPRYLKSVQVKVPVSALKCGHAAMEKSLRRALKAEDPTRPAYITAIFEAVRDGADTTNALSVSTVGALAIAGHENAVKMDVGTTRLPDGTIEARGAVPILMSDFGIEPPTALFGALRASNRVVVRFAMKLGPEVVAAMAARCSLAR